MHTIFQVIYIVIDGMEGFLEIEKNCEKLLRSMFSYQKSVLSISDAFVDYNFRKAAWLHVILSLALRNSNS